MNKIHLFVNGDYWRTIQQGKGWTPSQPAAVFHAHDPHGCWPRDPLRDEPGLPDRMEVVLVPFYVVREVHDCRDIGFFIGVPSVEAAIFVKDGELYFSRPILGGRT